MWSVARLREGTLGDLHPERRKNAGRVRDGEFGEIRRSTSNTRGSLMRPWMNWCRSCVGHGVH